MSISPIPVRSRRSAGSSRVRLGFVSANELAELLYSGALQKRDDGFFVQGKVCCEVQAAVRIVSCGGDPDRYGLVGTVESREKLRAAGATWSGQRMLLGGLGYRVEAGVLLMRNGKSMAS